MPEEPQGDPAPEKETPKDEPLGDGGKKALDAEREARKVAEASAKEFAKKFEDATKELAAVKNDGLPEWQQKLNELQARLDGEVAARQEADKKAAAAERSQYGIDKGLPPALAKKLTGATPEELDAEINELLPHLGAAGPRPNPQQGNPSQGRGGTLDAGRELFKQHNKT
jgi:hypothetical protein